MCPIGVAVDAHAASARCHVHCVHCRNRRSRLMSYHMRFHAGTPLPLPWSITGRAGQLRWPGKMLHAACSAVNCVASRTAHTALPMRFAIHVAGTRPVLLGPNKPRWVIPPRWRSHSCSRRLPTCNVSHSDVHTTSNVPPGGPCNPCAPHHVNGSAATSRAPT